MAEKSPEFAELYLVWMRIRNQMNMMENQPHDFGVDMPLHLSEIHTIQAIGQNPENNIRILSGLLGVTPSAASQVVSRLTKRGLVRKVRGIRDEREVTLELTETGRTAFQNHEKTHTRLYERIASRVGPMNEMEREVLARVFSAMESVYDERIREIEKTAAAKERSV